MKTHATSVARMGLVLLAALTGCGGYPDKKPLPDWSAGFEGGDSTESGAGDQIRLESASDIPIVTRLHATNSGNPCAVKPDKSGNAAIDCTLDIEELDLAYSLNYDFTVPADVCDYVIVSHYMYMTWEVGVGPADVSWTVDAMGNISSEKNAINGVPACSYDYSDNGAHNDLPNCCVGSYTLTVTGPSGFTKTGQWGGKPADCFGGAAYIDPELETGDEGWPMSKVTFLNKQAFTKRFTFDKLFEDFFTNVPLANYFDPANHEGSGPAGLRSKAAQTYKPRDDIEHYVLECVDNAEERYAVIRLVVKEWNEKPEFEKNGNPDTEGQESNGGPKDDRADWKTATPDATTYIRDFE